MASESQSRFAGAMRELLSFEMYKRSQGRRMRQLSAGGVGLFLLWGLKALSGQLVAGNEPQVIAYGVPVGLAAVFGWLIFRVYNWPKFADFLIATEAEMTKVSWSTKDELKRATVVVLLALFMLGAFLYSVDVAWSWILEQIGVLQVPGKTEETLLDWRSLPVAWDNWTKRG